MGVSGFFLNLILFICKLEIRSGAHLTQNNLEMLLSIMEGNGYKTSKLKSNIQIYKINNNEDW